MTDKKEVNILLLGIVAILAIVGLVLLFTSPAATGRMGSGPFATPPLPPQTQAPAGVGYTPQTIQATSYRTSSATIIPSLEGSNLPRCPGNAIRTRVQGNIPYAAISGYLCDWFYCPNVQDSLDKQYGPMLGCVKA